MKTLELDRAWPKSWQESHHYDQIEVFGKIPPTSLGYFYAYRMRQQKILGLVQKHLPPGSEILDIAAAQGNFSLILAEKGYKVIWNDLREELICYVGLKYERGDLRYLAGNCFEVCRGMQFDAVLITEIIEHVAHPNRFLQLVANLVRPGGFVFMTTPSGEYFKNDLPKFSDYPTPEDFEAMQFKPNSDGHIFLLYEEELHELGRQANLTPLEVSIHSNPLTSGHVKTHHLLPFLPQKLVGGIERATQLLPRVLRKKLHANWAAVYQKK